MYVKLLYSMTNFSLTRIGNVPLEFTEKNKKNYETVNSCGTYKGFEFILIACI